MSKKFYFRCKTNPSAPPLVLDTYWEAQEMRNHPDYERIDEFGETIVEEGDEAENPIPFVSASQALKRV
jgi:hypothetical protein